MEFTSALAMYFILWWLVLFAILPFGVKTLYESNEVLQGTVESAPIRPMLWRKAFATTIVSAIIFGLIYYAIKSGLSLDDFPF